MAQILLVDDDELYRSALRTVIQNFGHEVFEVQSAKDAQLALGRQKYDLMISDIRMPDTNGIELLHWSKQNFKMPVILITGFLEALESERPGSTEADDFLLKPFKGSDLNESIKALISDSSKDPSTDSTSDENYCKIPIDDLISGSRIRSDIFTKGTKNKYIRIGRQGENIELEKIQSYKKNGFKHLYLTREDFCRYVHFEASCVKTEHTDFRNATEAALNEIRIEGVSEEEYNKSKELLQNVLDLIQHNEHIEQLLIELNKHHAFLFKHSLATALYATMAARSIGWVLSPIQFKIALSGLLHNIGLKDISKEIISKKKSHLSAEERALYETHPQKGFEILSALKGLPEGIAQIAYQHHESMDGRGYPLKLNKQKIFPLARLISAAELFCEYALDNPLQEKQAALKVIQQMNLHYRSSLDPEVFNAFKKLFKFDLLAELTS